MHQANLAFLLTFLYSARFSRDKLGATEDSVNYEGEKKNLQLHAILTAERYKWLSSFSTNCIKQSEFSMQQEGTSLSDGFLLLPTPVTPSCESLQHYSSEWSSVQAGICESSSLPHLFLHCLFHTSSRIMLKRTSISLVYQEMRRLSSSTQGESLLLLQKCQQKSRIQLQTNIIPFAFWISQYQCKLHQVVFAKKTELHSGSNKSSTMSMRQGSTFTSDASHSWCCKFFLSFPFLSPFHFSTWCNSRPVPVHPSWRGWPELHQYLRWNIPEDLHRINTVFLCYSFRSILRLHTSQPHHISSSRYLL